MNHLRTWMHRQVVLLVMLVMGMAKRKLKLGHPQDTMMFVGFEPN